MNRNISLLYLECVGDQDGPELSIPNGVDFKGCSFEDVEFHGTHYCCKGSSVLLESFK